MKTKFLFFVCAILYVCNNITAQSVYNCTSSANVRDGSCTTGTNSYGFASAGQAFVVINTTALTCGYTWYQIDIPSAHNITPTTAYVADVNFSISGSPNNYLTVLNYTVGIGLKIFNAPAGSEVWIYHGIFDWASFEIGQKLARTSASPVMIGSETWYQVYVTPNCYASNSLSSSTVSTGWVSDGIGIGGPYVVPYSGGGGCTAVVIASNPSGQTVTSGNSATFNVSVTGTPPFSYFWYSNSGMVNSTIGSSSTSNSYTTPALSTSDNGSYYYCIVTNCSSTDQAISSNAYVTVNPSHYVTANFTYTAGCPGQTSYFYDNSTGIPSPNTWTWDFGDGSPVVHTASPTHVYTTSGSYVVSLTVQNSSSDINTQTHTVTTASPGVTAGITAPTGTLYTGAPLSFSDNSAYLCSTAASWTWSFGDGATSTLRNPAHTYSTAGTYSVALTACNNLGNCNTVSQTITLIPSPVTITINSVTQIDQWQRANNSYTVSLTATTSDGSMWQIVAHDMNGFNTDQFSPLVASGASNTWYFDFPNPTAAIQYYVVSTSGGTSPHLLNSSSMPYQTEIIEGQWINKNVVYYNDASQSLKIPLRNNPGTTSISYSFTRMNGASSNSDVISSGSVGSSNQYLIFINSTLQHLNPGIFTCHITYNGTPYSEDDVFDLTKIGNYGGFHPGNDTLIVLIGGNDNTIESDIQGLSGTSPTLDWSIIQNFNYIIDGDQSTSATYNTWYIAQSNENFIANNAYDIGTGLDSILNIISRNIPTFSTNPNHYVVLFAHSYGGVQVRAMLEGLGKKLNEPADIPFINYGITPNINEVIFLGSPHQGMPLLAGTSIIDGDADAEMTEFSPFLNNLANSLVPNYIHFLNITGYDPYSPVGILNPLSDGVVPVWSSEKPIFHNSSFPNFNPFQLYIVNSSHLLYSLTLHTALHHTNILRNSNDLCDLSFSNLNKIFQFIRTNSIEVCPELFSLPLQVILSGSVLPNAMIKMKQMSDTIYSKIGVTDENGILNTTPATLSIGDSLMISASGYEPLIIGLDSNNLSIGKVTASMLKSLTPTNKVEYAALELVNHNPITSDNTIQIKATAQNTLSYQINSPLNQDTAFIPLTLSSNIFTTTLDTGYNQVFVRFIGASDTVTLSKGVYYLPGSLMTQYAYNVIINCDTSSLATKMYINNQFVKQISSLTDTIAVPIGENLIRFSKFGYIDSLISVDSTTTINISLHLFPHSYSSPTDSNIIDFTTGGKIQYRKNVTAMDTALRSIISLKQYDDSFASMALIPKSRKFEMKHLNTNWSDIRFAAVLDQIGNLSEDSTYLMKISNDTSFTKIAFNSIANVAAYDSEVQKLTYNYINFDSGTAATEALVIMKKQPPVTYTVPTINMNENDSLILPLTTFFADPDSMHDITYSIATLTPPGLHLSVINGNLRISTDSCYTGSTSISMNVTHDWIMKNMVTNVVVTPLSHPAITASGATYLCYGNTVELSSHAASNYQWLNNNLFMWDVTDSVITIIHSGNYSVISYNGACYDTSNTIHVTIDTPLIPIVNLAIKPGSIITQGQPDTLVATVINGGYAPTYKWYINGMLIPAATTSSFSYGSFVNNDSVTCVVTDSGQCGLSSYNSIIINITDVGVKSIMANGKITILPNPNNGAFIIQGALNIGKNIANIEITNMEGRVIYKKEAPVDNGKINEAIFLTGLPSGVYILNINSGVENNTYHFIIEK